MKILSSKDHKHINAPVLHLIHEGPCTEEILLEIRSLAMEVLDKKVFKRLFPIIVEVFQNIDHHSAKREIMPEDPFHSPGIGSFEMRILNKEIKINTKNLIYNYEIAPLKQRIEHINVLSPPELRSLYHQTLNMPQRLQKVGANLGLIDMVKRSTYPIKLSFDNLDQHTSTLNLSVSLRFN